MNWLPALVYSAALLAVTLPLIARNCTARVIGAVFVAAVVLIDLGGLPQIAVYSCLHSLAFIACVRLSHIETRPAAALFVPMAIVDGTALAGWVSEYDWWWLIFALAMAQLGMLAGVQGKARGNRRHRAEQRSASMQKLELAGARV